MRNAAVLMKQGAQMVKIEGGGWTAPIVRFLVDRGVGEVIRRVLEYFQK